MMLIMLVTIRRLGLQVNGWPRNFVVVGRLRHFRSLLGPSGPTRREPNRPRHFLLVVAETNQSHTPIKCSSTERGGRRERHVGCG
jgi:hypothetical protein